MDRIIASQKIVGLHKKSIKDISPIKCPKCEFVLGVPYIYKKEKRKAFRVFQDTIIKKVKKLNN